MLNECNKNEPFSFLCKVERWPNIVHTPIFSKCVWPFSALRTKGLTTNKQIPLSFTLKKEVKKNRLATFKLSREKYYGKIVKLNYVIYSLSTTGI